MSSIISGIKSYKRVYWPINKKIYMLSPLSNRKIYILLLLEELIWSAINEIELNLFLFITLVYIDKDKLINFVLAYLLTSTASICIFILSIRFIGRLRIEMINKSVRIIRVILYMLTQLILFCLGYKIITIVCKPVLIIRKAFYSLYAITDKSIEDVGNNIITYCFLPLKEKVVSIFFNQANLSVIIGRQFYSLNICSYLIIFIISILLLVISFYIVPDYSNIDFIRIKGLKNNDILYRYIKYLHNINKKYFNNDFLLEKEIIIFEKSRWIISPIFFNIAVVSSDYFLYVGVLVALSKYLTSKGTLFIILIIFNIIILFNHANVARIELPSIFTLSHERKNINLIKLSGNSSSILYDAKLSLMRIILIIPSFMCLITDIVFIIYKLSVIKTTLVSSLILLFLLLVFLFWIAPKSVLYMSPLVSNFNLKNDEEIIDKRKENDLYNYFCRLPRKFTVAPILLILYINSFVNILNDTIIFTIYLLSIFYN
jgi:hypothetical protein